MPELKVATAQFPAGVDTDANLGTMLHLISEAAAQDAKLIHFQEFCNHPAWYGNQDHAWQAAITIPGPMIDAIGAAAHRHSVYVSFNATVRGPYPTVYDQNHLVGPDGQLLGANAKQVLMHLEADYFTPAVDEGVVVETEYGGFGLMSCMDGLIPETARVLAVKGADLILNSLSSNGRDEAHTHIPARGVENGVFVVSANRVGTPVGDADMPALVEMTGISESRLQCAGESQIVDPDGVILARADAAPRSAIVYATVDLARSKRAERLARRRPECYELLVTPNDKAPFAVEQLPDAGRVAVAAASIGAAGAPTGAIEAAVEVVRRIDAALIVLPELAVWDGHSVAADPATAVSEGEQLVAAIQTAAAETGKYVVVGIPFECVRDHDVPTAPSAHNGAVVIGPDGLLLSYAQIHGHPSNDGWSVPGDALCTVDLPFGRLGVMVGFDLQFPESARTLARRGADLIACPMTWRAAWEADLLVAERAAENHVALICAARSDGSHNCGSMICMPPDGYRFPITGEVNMPERLSGRPGETVIATVDLRLSRDKRLMGRTDLLRDCRPELYGALHTSSADPS